MDLDLQPSRQRIDHRDPDTVQATGDRVAAAAELAARVQRREHDLDRRPVLDRVLIDGDAAAVVHDRDPAVGEQGDVDVVGVPGQRLVDGVVDDLVDEVVQPALTGGTDVHAGPFADGVEALKNLIAVAS